MILVIPGLGKHGLRLIEAVAAEFPNSCHRGCDQKSSKSSTPFRPDHTRSMLHWDSQITSSGRHIWLIAFMITTHARGLSFVFNYLGLTSLWSLPPVFTSTPTSAAFITRFTIDNLYVSSHPLSCIFVDVCPNHTCRLPFAQCLEA
jgi:hypothetical protein